MQPYKSARSQAQSGILLDANENPYGQYNRYPDPNAQPLRRALAAYTDTPEDTIIAGNGSNELIDLIMRAFRGPIYIPEPTYGMYKVFAQINDIPITDDPTQANLAFYCSPNNPTGETINSIDFPGITVVDEAYWEFCNQPSFALRNNRTIVLRTLSKAYAAAAIRLGYAIANPEIIAILDRIKPPYNVNQLTQDAAIKLLQTPPDIATIISERQRLQQAFKELKIQTLPSQANFILFFLPQASKVQQTLAQKGLTIRDQSDKTPNALRLTIGTPEQNNQFLTQLKCVLQK